MKIEVEPFLGFHVHVTGCATLEEALEACANEIRAREGRAPVRAWIRNPFEDENGLWNTKGTIECATQFFDLDYGGPEVLKVLRMGAFG